MIVRACLIAMLLATFFGGALSAAAQSEFVIFSFADSANQGSTPTGNLASDAVGNLYGTSFQGGEFFAGNVFELVRPVPPHKQWIQKVLYTFTWMEDGGLPSGGVIFDKAGNLYGTTIQGGTANLGTVFRLSPPGTDGGDWTETVLYSFLGGAADGALPNGVVFDKAGNLYGTTSNGGFTNTSTCTQGCGTVFELASPTATSGGWTEKVIQFFHYTNGGYPKSVPIIDARGDLYGTTVYGGPNVEGTVYRLAPPATEGGNWAYRVLYAFQGFHTTDSAQPFGSLTLHGDGILYGTASYGGTYEYGTVFQLVPPSVAGGAWTENILLNFNGNGGDRPGDNVIFDKAGNLYSTTTFGGRTGCGNFGCGTVFRLSPPASPGAEWTETVLHFFPATQTDGFTPSGGVTLGKNGVLYGLTQGGVTSVDGTVFGIVP
jgi:uncharacterized repeat protein (TIGR03803 family)